MAETIYVQMTESERRRFMEALRDLLSDEVVLEQLTNGRRAGLNVLLSHLAQPNRIDDTSLVDEPSERGEVSRGELLVSARETIGGARADTYGDAAESFTRIAGLWSVKLGITVTAVDVAELMVLMKVSRLQHAPKHGDSWLDIAGYAALGAEIAGAKL